MIVCLVTAILHDTVHPYDKSILNTYDAILLHLLILVVSLQMVAFSNGFTVEAVEGLACLLLLLPVVAVLGVVLVNVIKHYLPVLINHCMNTAANQDELHLKNIEPLLESRDHTSTDKGVM